VKFIQKYLHYFNFSEAYSSLTLADYEDIRKIRHKIVSEIRILIDICKHMYTVLAAEILNLIYTDDEDYNFIIHG